MDVRIEGEKVYCVTYKCPICGKEFETLSSVKIHFQECHRALSKCPICGKSVRRLICHAKAMWLNSNCEQHATLYYLLSVGHKISSKHKGMYFTSRDIAENVLSLIGVLM